MANALEPDERADLTEMRRTWVHAAAVPKELQAAKARVSQALQSIWTRAKPDNDFAAFAGPFTELVGDQPGDRRGQGRGARRHASTAP